MKPSCPVLRRSEYDVIPVDIETGYEIVKNFHYARSGSNTATFVHGLFRKGDIFHCLGVAWWIPPTRSAAEASYDGDWQKVLSLSRLALVDGLPQNAASFLIGQSVKLIRADGRWECLVTYADKWRNHTGQIYKATNWQYMGETKPEPTFIDPRTGELVARKAGPTTRTRAEMAALGYQNIGKFAKHKFRMIISTNNGV